MDFLRGARRRALIASHLAFVVINNMYCIPTFVIWMMMLRPLLWSAPDLYWRIEGILFHWLLAIVSSWSWMCGYDLMESGDDLTPCVGNRCLILSNHQSTADVPLLMAAWNSRQHVLPNIMWIMDKVFKYTNFGVVSVIHEDFFILSGRTHRDMSLKQLDQHLIRSYLSRERHFIVLFPEGGFLRKRKPISHRFALKNNLPLLEYVALPRSGALKTIFDRAGPYANEQRTPTRAPTIDNKKQEKEEKKKELKNSNNIPVDENNIPKGLPSISNEPSETSFNNVESKAGLDESKEDTEQEASPEAAVNSIKKAEAVTQNKCNDKHKKELVKSNSKLKTTNATSATNDIRKSMSEVSNDKSSGFGKTSEESSETSTLRHRPHANKDEKQKDLWHNCRSNLTEIPNDKIQWIVDVTIAYPDQDPLDLPSIVTGRRPPCATNIFYRIFPSNIIPKDEEDMTNWLYELFYQKEKMLEEFYKTGSFPKVCPDGIERDNTPKLITQDALRFFILNIFFISSTFLHYTMLKCLITTAITYMYV